jgi:hypothetical protein
MRQITSLADYDLDQKARRSACISRTPDEAMGPLGHKPWWIDFPINGQYFTYPGVIDTPALGSNFTAVLSFLVPPGWDGVIRKHSWNYTGVGFVQGNGDLTFSVRVAGAMVKTYSAVQTEIGSPQQPRDTFIIVRENQLVEYLVSVDAGAGIPIAGTFIIAFADGWFRPRSGR